MVFTFKMDTLSSNLISSICPMMDKLVLLTPETNENTLLVVIRLNPVSYTHLDVYKRQIYTYPLKLPFPNFYSLFYYS